MNPISIGDRYGKRIVIARGASRGNHRLWVMRCDCGDVSEVYTHNVRKTLACGHCAAKRPLKHGHGSHANRTPEYRAWSDMKARCLNPNNGEYHNYGGRGIAVCDRWLNSFEDFLADLGLRPSDKHSLERKDVNGNYEPDNCCWLLLSLQHRNKRTNSFISYAGERRTVTEWARRLGIDPSTLMRRLQHGWTIHDALTIGCQENQYTSRRVRTG